MGFGGRWEGRKMRCLGFGSGGGEWSGARRCARCSCGNSGIAWLPGCCLGVLGRGGGVCGLSTVMMGQRYLFAWLWNGEQRIEIWIGKYEI